VLGDVLSLDPSVSSRESAIESYRRAIEQTALKGGAYLVSARTRLAETYLEAKGYRQAIEQFSEALQFDPTSARTLRGLGHAYSGAGRAAEAERAFESAAGQQSGCWYNRWTLAKFYGRQGCDAKAVEQMEAVVAADPENLYVQSALASYYLRLERYAQAEKTLKYVIARQPRVVAISNLGWAYYLSQRFDESLEQMELAAGMDPDNPALSGNLGELALLLPGREEQARIAFRRAVDLGARALESNPDDAFGWAINGYWRARLGDRAGGLNSIARALGLAPANKEVQFRSAASYEMLGMRREALDALERALELGFSVNEVHRSEPLTGLLESEPYRKIEQRIIALRQVRGGVDACELSAEPRTAKLN
jgi:serine/threonine-protein kinase